MSNKQELKQHKMIKRFKRIASLVGNTAYRYHSNWEGCQSHVDAESEAKRRIKECIDRICKPLYESIDAGSHRTTISCVQLFSTQVIRHISIRFGFDVVCLLHHGNKAFDDFIEDVTMYAVMSDQTWGTACDELLNIGGEA